MPRNPTPLAIRCLVGPLVLAQILAGVARADSPAPVTADPLVDGAIIGGTALVALGLRYLHVNDAPDAWRHEVLGDLDRSVRGNFSARARKLSDLALAASVAVPSAFAVGTTWDAAAGDRALVMMESIAVALLATSATKTLVGRPRPYTYKDDPAARDRARAVGRDARRSFFSGHSATAFAALAAGGAIYATREPDRDARALAWGAGAAIAAATATWRVRAGEHFYSDVIVGALVGAGAGTLVNALHAGEVYRPSAMEWGALAGGLVLGTALSAAVPLGEERATLAPIPVPSGAGLGLVGAF